MSTVTPTLEPSIVAVRSARRRVARRTAYAITGLTVVWIAVFLVRITQGDYLISLPDVVRIIRGAEIPGASYILMESKLPRAVLGTGVGVALGLAGAIFQTTLRNELASPDIVGVTLDVDWPTWARSVPHVFSASSSSARVAPSSRRSPSRAPSASR